MARKKRSNAEEEAREELKAFNDLRFTSGVEGVAAKEERAIERWMEQIREKGTVRIRVK